MAQAEWDAMHSELRDPHVTWRHGYRRRDMAALDKVRAQGRLHFFAQTAQIGTAVKAVRVGGHTPGMLAIVLAREVLAGDNAYLFEIAPPLAVRALAAGLPLIPGHDPTLLDRYPKVSSDVVRLP